MSLPKHLADVYFTTFRVENSHESASRALLVDGRSHGFTRDQLLVEDFYIVEWQEG